MPDFDTDNTLIHELRELPILETSRDLWPETRRRWRRKLWLQRGLPLAALLFLGLGIFLFMGPALKPEPKQLATGPELQQLKDASEFLEAVLQSPRLRRKPVSARQAAAIFHIEDRVAGLDQALNEVSKSRSQELEAALWAERVQSLDQLVQLRTNPNFLARNNSIRRTP